MARVENSLVWPLGDSFTRKHLNCTKIRRLAVQCSVRTKRPVSSVQFSQSVENSPRWRVNFACKRRKILTSVTVRPKKNLLHSRGKIKSTSTFTIIVVDFIRVTIQGHASLRSWRYCVGARLKFWRRSCVPKKRE